jgi:hypothetical protein
MGITVTIRVNLRSKNGPPKENNNIKVMNFQKERKKTTYFNRFFYLSPYRFTQISSVGTRWMQNYIQFYLTVDLLKVCIVGTHWMWNIIMHPTSAYA